MSFGDFRGTAMWSNRNIRRVALARLISRTGGEAAFFVGIWGRAAYEFDATPGQIALMMAALGVTHLAGTGFAGVLVDRFGPRRVLMVSEIFFAPAALALILPTSMAQMTFAVGLVGLLSAFVYTAVVAFPPYVTDNPDQLAATNAAVDVAGTVGFIAGPALGAVLARYVSIDAIFIADAATSLIGVALIAPVATRVMPASERTGAVRELREGFRFAYSVPRLRFLLGLGTLTWLSFGVFSSLEPIFYREILGTGPEALGVVNAIFGVGLLGGSMLLARFPRSLTTVRAAVLLTLAGGGGAIAYTAQDDVRVVAVAGIAWGLVLGALLPVLRTLVQGATPDGMQGRAMGVLQTHHTVGEMLPLAVVPALAAALGIQQVLVGSGGVVVLIALLCLPAGLRMSRAAASIAHPMADGGGDATLAARHPAAVLPAPTGTAAGD